MIVLLYNVIKKTTTNELSPPTQFILDTPCSYFAVRELDNAIPPGYWRKVKVKSLVATTKRHQVFRFVLIHMTKHMWL